MSKVRTTIALSTEAHDYLKSRAHSHGQMAEYLDRLLLNELRTGPLDVKLNDQANRLERLLAALETTARR
jgi:hypothetical protein